MGANDERAVADVLEQDLFEPFKSLMSWLLDLAVQVVQRSAANNAHVAVRRARDGRGRGKKSTEHGTHRRRGPAGRL